MSGFTTTQQQILAVITKCSSLLSMSGSGFIIQEILRYPTKRESTYHRLLLAMSISDFIASLWIFIGTWAIPIGTPYIYMTSGNTTSCKVQGFFIQLSLTTTIYNGCLAIYYLLNIKYGWKEQSFRKIEPIFHIVALSWGFGTASAGLIMDQYNPSLLYCWLSGTNKTNILRLAFAYDVIWSIMIFVTIAMFIVYQYVKQQENYASADNQIKIGTKKNHNNKTTTTTGNASANILRNSTGSTTEGGGGGHGGRGIRTSTTGSSSGAVVVSSNSNSTSTSIFQRSAHRRQAKRRCKHSRKVAIQSAYYVGAFYVTYAFPSVTRIIQAINGNTYYVIVLLFAICFPLQGFLNCCVYLRPRYLRYRKVKSGSRSTIGQSYNRVSSMNQHCNQQLQKQQKQQSHLQLFPSSGNSNNNNNNNNSKNSHSGIISCTGSDLPSTIVGHHDGHGSANNNNITSPNHHQKSVQFQSVEFTIDDDVTSPPVAVDITKQHHPKKNKDNDNDEEEEVASNVTGATQVINCVEEGGTIMSDEEEEEEENSGSSHFVDDDDVPVVPSSRRSETSVSSQFVDDAAAPSTTKN